MWCANSIVNVKDGQTVAVGDEFSDAQGRSIVVQVGGSDPGVGACNPTPAPPVTPPKPPLTPIPDEPATPVTPGTNPPRTGGDGSDLPVGLIGGGVMLASAGVLAAQARRRRRGLAGS